VTNLYLEQFKQQGHSGDPAWLKALRQRSMESFQKLGFPTPRQEEWKYLNFKGLAETPFVLTKSRESAQNLEKLQTLRGPQAYRLTFVNGRFSPELSDIKSLPRGLTLMSLKDRLQQDDLQKLFSEEVKPESHPFVALNSACFEDGAFVQLEAGTILDRPIEISHVSSPNGLPSLSHPRHLVVAGSGSQATLVESYEGDRSKSYFTNPVMEMHLQENAVVDHIRIERESPLSFHVASTGIRQARQSQYRSVVLSLGAALNRHDLGTVLSEEGSECQLQGLYVANGKQVVDNHTSIDHAEAHCVSQEMYKGILSGHAQATFNGRILVRPDAQKTSSRQSNKNLLLSDDAIVNTKPLLEIHANDVKCNHGATVGRLDENQVFYLRSRGIERDLARKLLTFAFAHEVLAEVRVPELREKLEKIIKEAL